jgi:hypothetical protein
MSTLEQRSTFALVKVLVNRSADVGTSSRTTQLGAVTALSNLVESGVFQQGQSLGFVWSTGGAMLRRM